MAHKRQAHIQGIRQILIGRGPIIFIHVRQIVLIHACEASKQMRISFPKEKHFPWIFARTVVGNSGEASR